MKQENDWCLDKWCLTGEVTVSQPLRLSCSICGASVCKSTEMCQHAYSICAHLCMKRTGVIAAQTARDKQDMLRGVGWWPVDTAEEAAVRRRRGGRRVQGRDRRRAAHCGGQSALTEQDLSRLDRWTDRATPRWQPERTDTSARTGKHSYSYSHSYAPRISHGSPVVLEQR